MRGWTLRIVAFSAFVGLALGACSHDEDAALPSVHADATAVFAVDNVVCGACNRIVRRAATSLPGVASIESGTSDGVVVVRYDTKQVGPATIAAAITRTGFRARVIPRPAL